MPEPQTVNVGLIVPNTGDLVDTWGDDATNPDFVAIDGLFAGVQTISATSIPITLTAPAGFVPTPGGGPTQAQNRVLRFTGVLTADVVVTLPLPGSYIVENLTTGNFVLSFRGVTATEVIGTPQGECIEIYNDGANVRFVNLARMGAMDLWSGLSAMPAWVTACTVDPYLLCDGAIYNIADYPHLGGRLLAKFGGNGLTTFGVPDMQGRVPLAYDGTGVRITVAGCGINGQTLGASLDTQTDTLTLAQLPTGITVFGTLVPNNGANTVAGAGAGGFSQVFTAPTTGGNVVASPNGNIISVTGFVGTLTSNNTHGDPHPNVQPSLVAGIWVVKT